MSDSEVHSSSEDFVEEERDENWDDWDEDEDEYERTKSLFSDAILPSPAAAIDYDAKTSSFDIRQYAIALALGEYDILQCINYIRSEVADGRDPLPTLTAAKAPGPYPWSDEKYLRPILTDDPLLTYDYLEDADPSSSDAATAGPAAGPSSSINNRPQEAGQTSSSSSPSSSQATATAAAGCIPSTSTQATPAAAGGTAGTSEAGPLLTSAVGTAGAAAAAAAIRRAAALEEEVELLRLKLAALTEMPLIRELLEGSTDNVPSPSQPCSSSQPTAPPTAPSASAAGPGPSSSAAAAAGGGAGQGSKGRGAVQRSRVDQLYFESYSYFDIHREMLGDKARTEAYRDALVLNPSLMQGARVLDVGCGTGILSMFAARGGAAAVVGLEASDRMAGFARQVVESNGLSSVQGGPINIINSKVEETEDIGVEKVDVLVSEWMGYALLFETMLDSVLLARDRWLRPGGAILPDVAVIKVAGAAEGAMDLDFWKDVYGFSMAPIAQQLRQAAAAGKPLVRQVSPKCLVTQPVTIHTLDLATMKPEDQDFSVEFTLNFDGDRCADGSVRAEGVSGTAPAVAEGAGAAGSAADVAAVVLWFDVEFSKRFCKDHPVVLSTSPEAVTTHWVQTVLPLQQVEVLGGEGNTAVGLKCRLSMARSKRQHRTLDMSLEYQKVDGEGKGVGGSHVAVYLMDVTGGE